MRWRRGRGQGRSGHASSPVFFAAPGTPSSLSLPLECEGTQRRAAHPYSIHASRRGRPLAKGARLSALHSGVHTATGPRFRLSSWRAFRLFRRPGPVRADRRSEPTRPAEPTTASQLPGRKPLGHRAEPRRRPGAGGAFVSCPQAPHPIPPTSRFMRALSVDQTAGI
jgi:hypothetical protein